MCSPAHFFASFPTPPSHETKDKSPETAAKTVSAYAIPPKQSTQDLKSSVLRLAPSSPHESFDEETPPIVQERIPPEMQEHQDRSIQTQDVSESSTVPTTVDIPQAAFEIPETLVNPSASDDTGVIGCTLETTEITVQEVEGEMVKLEMIEELVGIGQLERC